MYIKLGAGAFWKGESSTFSMALRFRGYSIYIIPHCSSIMKMVINNQSSRLKNTATQKTVKAHRVSIKAVVCGQESIQSLSSTIEAHPNTDTFLRAL